MNPFKIVGWVGLAVAIVGAFVEIPYAGLILLVLGLVVGVAIAAEDHVRVLVTALVLTSLSGVFAANIENDVGGYLTGIYSNLGLIAAGAALTIVTRNIWRRYKP